MESYFYVADDARSLADRKLVLMGLYADRVLVMNIPSDSGLVLSKATPGLVNISLVVCVVGLPPGDNTFSTRVILPDGADSEQRHPDQTITAMSGGSSNIILKFTPLVVPMVGTYTLLLTIAGEEIASKFEVQMAAIAEAT